MLAASRALILDPLAGHTPARTQITDPDLRETIKELAQLDGAFVISEDGIVVAAFRYLDASVEQIALPLGFGSCHLAAASISQRIGAVAIVVSESGVVRVFHAGQIEATLIPQLWLLDRHHTQLSVAAAGPSKRPQCRELLKYRHKSPVLSVAEPNDRQPRERLRYVSGWFCNNAACEYRELAG